MSLPIQYQFIYSGHGPEMSVKPLSIDQYVDDGDILTVGEDRIEVLHAPGHSPGSILLHIPSCNSLMSGDLIFEDSIGRTDFPLSSKEDFIKSINEKVLPLDGQTQVYSGHDITPFLLEDWKPKWETLKQYV
jgi:glyoxylase-like metal-dependent hydrolase (beta-lactamase superfamily II)